PVAREDRLRAEALHDERELLAAELEHERARPARLLDNSAAVGGDQRRRGLGVADRGALALVEDVVVDARLAVLAAHASRTIEPGRGPGPAVSCPSPGGPSNRARPPPPPAPSCASRTATGARCRAPAPRSRPRRRPRRRGS